MVFLRALTASDPEPILRGAGVVLRPPLLADYDVWAAVRGSSRAHLAPFEPTWADDELSRASYRRRLKHHHQQLRDDLGYAFFIIHETTGALLGGLTLSNVRRGVAQTASLGYWLGASQTRKGYMHASLQSLLPFAFGSLGLHRIEAACLVDNQASARVLERTGFAREGLARRYLKINGIWQDHLLYARLAGDDAERSPARDDRGG